MLPALLDLSSPEKPFREAKRVNIGFAPAQNKPIARQKEWKGLE
jgi:hypothetical protein